MQSGNQLLATAMNSRKTISESFILFEISNEIEKFLILSVEQEILMQLANLFNIKGFRLATKIIEDRVETSKNQNNPKLTLIEHFKSNYSTFRVISEELNLTFI